MSGAPAPEPPRPSDQVLVHFYRAVVGHADAWRQRMDATTNWAAATTAAMISVAFTSEAPHFILLVSFAFDTMFLLMESRRYQVYDLWRRRVQWMNRYYISPALSPEGSDPRESRKALEELARDLGRTVPHLRLRHAIGYRLQRNYGYLYGVALMSWILKLGVYPGDAEHLPHFLERARIGPAPGAVVLSVVLALVVTAFVLAVQAPSERMLSWTESPSTWQKWRDRRGRPAPNMRDDLPPAPIDV